MDAVKYLKEFYRLCHNNGCGECPMMTLVREKGYGSCRIFRMEDPEADVSFIEKWSEENPVKTYKSDFLEKFPKAKVTGKTKTPTYCRDSLYGTSDGCEASSCCDCWNTAMKD